jgi:ABC-type Fe3+/spermidine/putrescine transport system ATPase subunit
VSGAISVEGVTKRFGALTAVRRVSLEIAEREFVTLLGPSGCGKTTLLRMLAGFVAPDEGAIRVGGVTLSTPESMVPPERRGMGMVFQNYAVWPHKTVFENVVFGLRLRKFSAADARRKVGEALALVNLTGLEGRYPNELSGGQQQRVALARALAKRPAVLLLDEPLGALDLKLRKQMQTELSRIHRQVGTTFVFVTHDQEEALSMATRIAIMSGGNVMQTGTPREVYDHPVDRFVASFVGETNFISGSVTTEDGRRVFAIPGRGRVAAPTGSTDKCEVTNYSCATIVINDNFGNGYSGWIIIIGKSTRVHATNDKRDRTKIVAITAKTSELIAILLGFASSRHFFAPTDGNGVPPLAARPLKQTCILVCFLDKSCLKRCRW